MVPWKTPLSWRVRTLALVLGVLAAYAGPSATPTSAFAGESIISTGVFAGGGSGNGELSDPTAVAVNDATKDVYVVDHGNKRVEYFSAGGSYVGQFDGSPKVFGSPEYVAVDNSGSALDPSKEDVYVADTSDNVVDQFTASGTYVGQLTGACETEGESPPECAGAGAGFVPFEKLRGVAVSPEGDVWVYRGEEIHAYEFSDTGVFLKGFRSGRGANPGFAVDSGGDVYTVNGSDFVSKWEPATGTELAEFGKATPTALVVDSATNGVFLDRASSIEEYAEPYAAAIATGPKKGLAGSDGIAVTASSTSTIYATQSEANNVETFDVAILPTVVSSPVSAIYPRIATLNGTVNPGGLALSECEFEYVAAAEYEPSAANPYAAGHTVPCAEGLGEGAGEIGKGTEPVEVHAEVKGLLTGTTYHFRLQGQNANGTEVGADETFQATPPTAIESESVSEVTDSSATLEASIDPSKAPTTYHFEYDTTEYNSTAAHGTSVPVPDISVGSGEVPVEVRPEHIDGLAPGTPYHYRVVATSDIEVAPHEFETKVFDGADHTFTTRGTGAFALPDARQWEMVSPPDKNGALIEPIGVLAAIQAAADGSAITYVTNTPTEPQPGGFAGLVQVLSTRGGTGSSSWQSRDIAIPHSAATGVSALGQEYRFFSEDLSHAIVQPFGSFEPSLSGEASEQTPYLRTDYSAGASGQPCTSSCYRPLVTGQEGFANVPEPGTAFGEQTEGECPNNGIFCGPTFEGATSDLSHVVLTSGVPLTEATETTPAASIGDLYEWAGGKLQLVSVLPEGEGGEPVSGAILGLGGTAGGDASRHAVSDDGSRVFWTAGPGGPLYMREMVKHKTLRLDVPEQGCPPEDNCGKGAVDPEFQGASSDGSRVFFADTQKLTPDAGAYESPRNDPGTAADLYECEIVEVAGELKCNLRDLTPSGMQLGSVLGSSEDGSWVYFVANGVLAPGAVPGACENQAPSQGFESDTCNLYVRHGDATRLVVVLSGADEPDWGVQLASLTARVSSDGEWLAFMSDRALTGYDNRDASSGKPDEEVYLYNGRTGQLVCASCDPTGARPHGVEYGVEGNGAKPGLPLAGGVGVWPATSWLAANVPSWTPYEGGSAVYQSRYLSNTGRLFFNSSDALVPKDVNGTGDVYEYEPEGEGPPNASCGPAAGSGGDVFKAARSIEVEGRSVQEGAGCLGLISSGESSEESAFLDASETGADVFFLTTSQLAPQDFDDALDIYDAQECTLQAPCPPPSAAQPPTCATEASCKPAPSSQPEIFGLSGSATFSGAGNLAPPPQAPAKPKSAARLKAEKLAKALKLCKKDKKKIKRSKCEKQARKRFGTAKKAKKASNDRRVK